MSFLLLLAPHRPCRFYIFFSIYLFIFLYRAQYTIEWIPGSKTNDDGEGMAPTIRVEKITPSGSYQILPKWFTDKMAPEIYARC